MLILQKGNDRYQIIHRPLSSKVRSSSGGGFKGNAVYGIIL